MGQNMWASWVPKVFGFIGIISGVIAASYVDAPNCMLLGLPTFKFFDMLSIISSSAIGFVTRQDNKSSEQVGAGVITIPTLTAEQKSLLRKKFEEEDAQKTPKV